MVRCRDTETRCHVPRVVQHACSAGRWLSWGEDAVNELPGFDLRAQTLNALDMAVMVTDSEGRITCWNSSAEALYGWSTREVVGRNVLEVSLAAEVGRDVREIMRQVMSGRPWSG